ncbi:putative N6-adenine methyltransferase-domain-containing protein [Tribonema minus]|uniref:Putative N6-adenine methyltransferase-domain-containing protein n=1 Tax=Tribonema minus TaxID=303371 RepID=A0A835ZDP6_9STRA|nr:putative N6-adenine methyltransferase-domain-containing protein [Tribonema minus]
MNGMMALPQGQQRSGVHIFEYDARFGKAYPVQFVQYDYNHPLDVPEHLRGACDYVLADPPYLNPQCVTEFFQTMQLLARVPWSADAAPDAEVTPMMFVTSPRNHAQLLRDMGMRRTPFQVKFQSKFATPIAIFLNYRSTRLGDFVHEDPESEDEAEAPPPEPA